MRLSIELEGVERLRTALRAVGSDFQDLRPAWRSVSDEIFSIRRAQFATAGRHSGRPWAPPKASTLSATARGNRGGFKFVGLPGRASDKMFVSMTTRGGPGGIYSEEPQQMTMGTAVRSSGGFPYPRAFHFGTNRQAPRPIDDFSDRDVRAVAAVFKRSFRERVLDRGFDYQDTGEIPF